MFAAWTMAVRVAHHLVPAPAMHKTCITKCITKCILCISASCTGTTQPANPRGDYGRRVCARALSHAR